MQNKESGAHASRWGHETAKKIACALGASRIGASSNECVYKGRQVVIKCAHFKTNSFGVSYKMMDRISSVIGAFELKNAVFEVRILAINNFKKAMRPTASRGASKGKVGIVRRDVFLQNGQLLKRVKLPVG